MSLVLLILLLALGGALLVAGLLGGTILLAWLLLTADLDAVIKLDLPAVLRDIWSATLLTLRGLFAVGQPGPQLHPQPIGPPVLLVPGFGLNRASLAPLARALHASGRTAWAITNRPRSAPVATYAASLSERVDELLRLTGASQVDLVGHSMGGSVAAWYVGQLGGGAKVRRLVTLGTAWGGTRLACFGRGPSTEMRPGTPTVTALMRPLEVPVIAIHSTTDPMVTPWRNTTLDWTRALRMSGIGHYEQLRAKRGAEALIRALELPLEQFPTGAELGREHPEAAGIARP